MKKEQVVGTRLPDAAVRDLEGYGGEGGIQIVACTALHDLARPCSEAENKALTRITVSPMFIDGF